MNWISSYHLLSPLTVLPGCLRVSVFDDDTLEGQETLEVALMAVEGFETLVNLMQPSAIIYIEDNDRGTII